MDNRKPPDITETQIPMTPTSILSYAMSDPKDGGRQLESRNIKSR